MTVNKRGIVTLNKQCERIMRQSFKRHSNVFWDSVCVCGYMAFLNIIHNTEKKRDEDDIAIPYNNATVMSQQLIRKLLHLLHSEASQNDLIVYTVTIDANDSFLLGCLTHCFEGKHANNIKHRLNFSAISIQDSVYSMVLHEMNNNKV